MVEELVQERIDEAMDQVDREEEMWSMKAIAGELQWIQSKDKANLKRMLIKAMELENEYFTRLETEKDWMAKRTMNGIMEAREHGMVV